MTIGVALFLIAVGAILRFAITDSISGVDLGTVGVILMVVGLLGLLIAVFYEVSARQRRDDALSPDRRPYERDPRY
jgi:beta-lactamase regulating signal transducer with metallopeptidase domain